eukprot:4611101-Prymnesium_polylepis.1
MDGFMRRHFRPSVYRAFSSLALGVARADLWRYCVLFACGGVYVDLDSYVRMPLDELSRAEDVAVLSLEGKGASKMPAGGYAGPNASWGSSRRADWPFL